MSRRSEIQLSPEEQRELIDSERVVVVSSLGRNGWPHSMPLWYVPRDGEIWIYTYAKSQKVKNLERDARATLLIETGHEYAELRGVEIEAEAEIHRDLDTVFEMAKALTSRYAGGAQVDDAAAAYQRAIQRFKWSVLPSGVGLLFALLLFWTALGAFTQMKLPFLEDLVERGEYCEIAAAGTPRRVIGGDRFLR